MSSPVLGHSPAGAAVVIDVERLVASRALLCAQSGNGKSWALRRLLEQTHGRIQQLVIDPEGEFYTLRERLPYVLAGREDGDCTADPRSAELLARRLLELGASAILDLSELSPDQREEFVARFVRSLVNAPRKLWHPVLVVVDEAHDFAPEAGKRTGGRKPCTDALVDLAAKGRKRGFALLCATTRLSKLSKDVAAESGNVIMGKAVLEADVRTTATMLGLERDGRDQVKRLRPGQFFAFGPALSSDEVLRVDVGPVESTHPKAGKVAPPAAPPRGELRRVLAELEDLAQVAAAEEDQLAAARANVAELQRQLREARAGKPSEEALEAARREGAAEAQQRAANAERHLRAAAERINKRTAELSAMYASELQRLAHLATAIGEPVDLDVAPARVFFLNEQHELPRGEPSQVHRAKPRGGAAGTRPAPPRAVPPAGAAVLVELDGVQQKILDELHSWDALGLGSILKPQLALLCGYLHPRSGGFSEPIAALKRADLVQYVGKGRVEITDDGRRFANTARARPRTSEDLQAAVLERLPNPEAGILRELLRVYPHTLVRDELALQLGYKHPRSGGFSEPSASLRKFGLIEYPERGRVRAAPVLFIEEA